MQSRFCLSKAATETWSTGTRTKEIDSRYVLKAGKSVSSSFPLSLSLFLFPSLSNSLSRESRGAVLAFAAAAAAAVAVALARCIPALQRPWCTHSLQTQCQTGISVGRCSEFTRAPKSKQGKERGRPSQLPCSFSFLFALPASYCSILIRFQVSNRQLLPPYPLLRLRRPTASCLFFLLSPSVAAHPLVRNIS